MCVCEFSDGKGGKEAKRWAPEWGEMWGSQELREQILMSPVSQRVEVSTGSGVCSEGE